VLLFPSIPFPFHFSFSKIKNCYFLPLLNLSKNEEWKEIAIMKLLFPSTPFISEWKEIAIKVEGNSKTSLLEARSAEIALKKHDFRV